jgi:transcriptional regulator with XRE-family HTH domain
MINNTFGQRMKSLRLQRGIKSREMADFLYLSHNTIWGYETGRQEPTFDTLVSIAKKLNTTTDYLLGLTDAGGGD